MSNGSNCPWTHKMVCELGAKEFDGFIYVRFLIMLAKSLPNLTIRSQPNNVIRLLTSTLNRFIEVLVIMLEARVLRFSLFYSLLRLMQSSKFFFLQSRQQAAAAINHLPSQCNGGCECSLRRL